MMLINNNRAKLSETEVYFIKTGYLTVIWRDPIPEIVLKYYIELLIKYE